MYIQSAWQIPEGRKETAEEDSLQITGDFFRKIIIRSDIPGIMTDDNGIIHCNIIDFLLREDLVVV